MNNLETIPTLKFAYEENSSKENTITLNTYNDLIKNQFIVQAIISYISKPDYRDYELLPFIENLLIAADLIDEPMKNK